MTILDNTYVQGAVLYGIVNMGLSSIQTALPHPEEVLRTDGKPSLLYRTFYSLFASLVFDFKSVYTSMATGKTLPQALTSVAVSRTTVEHTEAVK